MVNRNEEFSDEPPRINRITVIVYSFIFLVAPILTFLIGRLLDKMLFLPEFPLFPANLVVGIGVFVFGLAIGIKSTRLLYRVGRGLPWGEVRKQARSTRLVTTGLYACCRNPMTFGYSLLPCGMGIVFKSLAMTFFIPAIVFFVMIVWLKLWEEPILERRFGEVYREYKRRTPFLIPRFKPVIFDLTSPILSLFRKRRGKASQLRKVDRYKEERK